MTTRRLALGLGAVVLALAAALGLALLGRSAPPPAGAVDSVTCGYWADGDRGSGSALSAVPKHPPANNARAVMWHAGAWRICIDRTKQTIYLKSDIGMCLGVNSGEAAWQNCNGGQSQAWALRALTGVAGGYRVSNRQFGGVLCAEANANGSHILSNAASAGCSKGHKTWQWVTSPARVREFEGRA